MRTVVLIGAGTPAGREVLGWLATHRGEFMVDGLVDDGADARWLAEQVTEFTPLRLGITDEYAAASVGHEREEIALDAGLVDWELPELEVLLGEAAAAEVAGLVADITIVTLPGEIGAAAVAAAKAAGSGQVWLIEDEAGLDAQELIAMFEEHR